MTSPITTVPGATVPQDPTLSGSSSSSTDNTTLSSQAFLQLLVAQLKYQDPSSPVDTSSFMNETATLTQVQAMQQSAQTSQDMLAAQRAQTASSMVGRTVAYLGDDGSTKTGYVSAATISGTSPTLKIGDSTIDLSKITQVLDGKSSDDAAAAASSTSGSGTSGSGTTS